MLVVAASKEPTDREREREREREGERRDEKTEKKRAHARGKGLKERKAIALSLCALLLKAA
jgi:hypothetical protein